LVQFITRVVCEWEELGWVFTENKTRFFLFSQVTSRKHQNKCKSSYNSHCGYFGGEVTARGNIVVLQLEPRATHDFSKISVIISMFFIHQLMHSILTSVTLGSANNALPEDGVTAPKHVGAILI
jgi:hypothetical protein